MDWRTKSGTGALLAILGGIGIALGPSLGATDFGQPWSFIAGFVVGILTGVGVVLAISGLLDRRRSD